MSGNWKKLFVNEKKLDELNGTSEIKTEKPLLQNTNTKTNVKTNIEDTFQSSNVVSKETSASAVSSPVLEGYKAQMIAYFKKVFTENNIPGPDYQEFFNALEEQKSEPIPESTKYKMIYTSFKTMGLTPERLIETANKYKGLFATKATGYDQSNTNAYDLQVTSLQKQIEALDTKNLDIDKQMQELIDQKTKNIDQSKELKNTMQKNKKDLTDKKEIFHEAYDEMVAEIDKNIGLIEKYLQNKI